MRVDFYHIDAMETPHYLPVWRALRDMGVDARLVCVPDGENTAQRGWFDYDETTRSLRTRGLPYYTTADPEAHGVTTQNDYILAPYSGVHFRLMYGVTVYPEAWGINEVSVAPIEVTLTHGPHYAELLSRWKDPADLPIVGFPRFDRSLSGALTRDAARRELGFGDRPVLAYLPTWDANSSLDPFLDAVTALGDRFDVVLKPHHCTVRMEPERMARIEAAGVRCSTSPWELEPLLVAADIVLADARSGALTESVLLDRPTLGLVADPRELDAWLRPAGVHELCALCTDPASLTEAVLRVAERGPQPARAAWNERAVSYRDGTAAQHAAEAIVREAERRRAPKPTTRSPRVSIVLPTYQHGALLPLAVESVCAQTFADFELIVVNDGSTDDTSDVLAGCEDERLRVVEQPNRGLPQALNRGFELARGELLTWISADNYCAPFFLEALVTALDTRPSASLAISAYADIDAQGRITHVTRGQDLSLPSLLTQNPGIASFLYRRAAEREVGGYDPGLFGAEDWDMWLRLAEQGPIVYVPEILYYYRRHDATLTARIPDAVRESSIAVVDRALERREQSVDIDLLYPGIARRDDTDQARAEACLDLGTRAARSPFWPDALASRFIEAARELYPDADVARAVRLAQPSPLAFSLTADRYSPPSST